MCAFAVTNDFTAGTNAVASEVNQNFTDIETELNAFPTDGTLSDGAVSTTAKLANSIITSAKFSAATLVTEAEGLDSSDNDTSFPTTAAVKDYIDTAKGGTADLTFSSDSAIFNDTTPDVYTDLDLSGTTGLGATTALVYLRVTCTVGNQIVFRTNGDALAIGVNGLDLGVSGVACPAGGGGYVLVITDSSGIVEWGSLLNEGGTATVTVKAFLLAN